MEIDEIEIPLSGGNTSGQVVRVANTIRKSIRASSSTIHQLLKFLESEGFASSPRYFGIDDKGREILSYLEGRCEISDTVWHSWDVLASTAHLLREMHDVTARYQTTDEDQWAYEYPDKSKHEVICHNDFGLYNLVINEDQCTGVIDFDLAGPGPKLRDVAYAAYWLVPLSMHAEDMKPYTFKDIENNSARLKYFCKTYGVEFDASLLDMVSEVLHNMGDKKAMIQVLGSKTAAELLAAGHLDHWSSEAIAFDQQRSKLESNYP